MSCSPSEDRAALENGLRQKLISMENAVARLASVKAHLRGNADQVRKEIGNMVSHHLSLIRNREQELMHSLDQIVTLKESVLAHQQEMINQSIGACQQSLTCLRRSASQESIDVQGVLFRLNTLDLTPRENSHVAIEADSMGLRSVIADFGRVVTEDHGVKTGASLPVEVEDYEDDMGMVHKSVLRVCQTTPTIQNPLRTPPGSGPASHSVHNWLTRMPSGPGVLDTDIETLMKEYEEVTTRQPRASFSDSTCTSTFEVVARRVQNSLENSEDLFLSEGMKENDLPMDQWLDLPMDQWLLNQPRKMSYPTSLPEMRTIQASTSPMAVNMKRKLSTGNRPLSKDGQEYEFATVINSVLSSDNNQWICKPSSSSTVTQTLDTMDQSCASSVADTVIPQPQSKFPPFDVILPKIFPDSADELAAKMKKCALESQTANGFDEAAYLYKLRAMFPAFTTPAKPVEGWLETPKNGKRDRPVNETSDDVSTMQAVLGWKNILERIHASGEDNWLAPTARAT